MYHVSAQGVDERMIKLMYIIIKHVQQVQPVSVALRRPPRPCGLSGTTGSPGRPPQSTFTRLPNRSVNTVGLNNILFIQHNHKLNK